MDSFGFVYLWYDRHSRLFYLGSHYGREDDGYLASSKWFLNAYHKRPADFKRRIIARIYQPDKKALQALEQGYLDMIKPHELAVSANVMAGTHRYYNMKTHAAGGNGSANKGKSWPSWRKGLTGEMVQLRKDGLFCVIACDRPKIRSIGPKVYKPCRRSVPRRAKISMPETIMAYCEDCGVEFAARLARKGKYIRFCSRSCQCRRNGNFADRAENGRKGAAKMSETAKNRYRVYNDDGTWRWEQK